MNELRILTRFFKTACKCGQEQECINVMGDFPQE